MKEKVTKKTDDIRKVLEIADFFDLPIFEDLDGGFGGDTLYEDNLENIETRALGEYAYNHDYEFNYNSWEMTYEDEDGEIITVDTDVVRESEEYQKAAGEIENELYRAWKKSVEDAAERIFDRHHLVLEAVELHHEGIWDAYRITPAKGKTWKDVCEEIVETVNGVGMFWYENALDLLRVGPYKSYKEAAFSHLHWIKEYPSVYGTSSVEKVYYDNMNHYLRNW